LGLFRAGLHGTRGPPAAFLGGSFLQALTLAIIAGGIRPTIRRARRSAATGRASYWRPESRSSFLVEGRRRHGETAPPITNRLPDQLLASPKVNPFF